MTEEELIELEALAKAAMEQHPEETREILERAMVERKQEMWASIRKKAHRQMVLRKARPWAAAAAMLVAAILVTGFIGVSQARAGKEGLLVDIVRDVAGDVRFTFSENPMESIEPENFVPVDITDGMWEQIQESADTRLCGLLPKAMPENMQFIKGDYIQPSYNLIDLVLIYNDILKEDILSIQYTYVGTVSESSHEIPTDFGTSTVDKEEWDGISVYIIRDIAQTRLIWGQDDFMITVAGQIDKSQMLEVFNNIAREP